MGEHVATDFQHGTNFRHGKNLVVESDVVVGDNVVLGHNVVLKSGTRFGNHIDFADYCCTTGLCILGDYVDVRTHTTISKGLIIEDKVFIGPGVMTNHTRHVPHCRPRVVQQYLVSRIGYGSIVGASCWLMAGIRIGANVVVGGGTLVVKNLDEPGIYVGSPPRILRVLPPEYVVSGESRPYDFGSELVARYMPGLAE